jgi:hypothetical protein
MLENQFENTKDTELEPESLNLIELLDNPSNSFYIQKNI